MLKCLVCICAILPVLQGAWSLSAAAIKGMVAGYLNHSHELHVGHGKGCIGCNASALKLADKSMLVQQPGRRRERNHNHSGL